MVRWLARLGDYALTLHSNTAPSDRRPSYLRLVASEPTRSEASSRVSGAPARVLSPLRAFVLLAALAISVMAWLALASAISVAVLRVMALG